MKIDWFYVEEYLIRIFWLLVLGNMTGMIGYYFWKVISRGIWLKKQIQLGRSMLWIVMLFWLIPLLYTYWDWKEGGDTRSIDIRMFYLGGILKFIVLVLAIVWVIGMAIQAAVLIKRLRRDRMLCKTALPCSKETEDLFLMYCKELRINKKIRLRKKEGIGSPVLVGGFRPYVLLNTEELPENTMQIILLHELVHMKHRDYLIRILMIIITCVDWFSPIVRDMFWDMDAWNEFYCDMESISLCNMSANKYFSTIQKCMKQTQKQQKEVICSHLYESRKTMERRQYIMAYGGGINKTSKSVRISFAVGFFVVTLTFSYFASIAAVWAYTQLEKTQETEIQLEPQEIILEEQVEEMQLPEFEAIYKNISQLLEIRSQLIQFEIKAGENKQCGCYDLKAGESISVSLVSDEPVDVGIYLNGRYRYVSGTDIMHTFNITEDGRYCVVLRNRGSQTATGVIKIK